MPKGDPQLMSRWLARGVMSASKTLTNASARLPNRMAAKGTECSVRQKASTHGATTFYTSRFARPDYAKRIRIHCESAAAEIRDAITTYRERLQGASGTASNRKLISDILLPAFGPTLERFDADWKLRECSEQLLVREMGHVRIDISFTKPTVKIFEDSLHSREFGPEKIGYLYHLLGFRINLIAGGALNEDIEAICSALRFIYFHEREGLKKSLRRSKTYRLDREIRPLGKFCALCEELTALHSELRVRSTRGITLQLDELRRYSSSYCVVHAKSRPRCKDADAMAYRRLIEAMVEETRRDERFRQRFVALDSLAYEGPTRTTNFRLPQQDQSAAEFAYIANIRHVARRILSAGVTSSIAQKIDHLVQQGASRSEILQTLGISKHFFTKNCALAVARLKHQGKTTSEICRMLGMWPQSFSQKKATGGCFDFSPERNPMLIWWPYGDLRGSDIFYPGKPGATRPRKAASDYEGKDNKGRTIHRHTSRPDPLAVMLF